MNYPDFTNEEIAYVVSCSIVHDNCEAARRAFTKKYHKDAPPVRTLRDWRKRFNETLSVLPKKHSGGPGKSRLSEEKQAEIVGAFGDDPCTSQRKVAAQLDVSQSSVHRVLRENQIKHFKFSRVQELKEIDFEPRLTFCRSVLNLCKQTPGWHQKIVFSDEAVFHLNGQVNLHNCFYYSTENPHVTCTKPMKSQSVCFWAMITFDHGIVHHVMEGTVTGERYCNLLQEIVFPFLQRKRSLIYQQDGAPSHFSNAARTLLNAHLPDRWIGRGGPRNWPSRSPDLAMNDFWLWGFARDQIYKSPRPETIVELRDRIAAVLDSIDRQMIRRAYSNFFKRCEACVSEQGGHFEHLL